MLDEWEMLYLGTGIVMCRRITTDRMSDSSGVHGGHGALGAGEQVQVHANVPGGRRKYLGFLVTQGHTRSMISADEAVKRG